MSAPNRATRPSAATPASENGSPNQRQDQLGLFFGEKPSLAAAPTPPAPAKPKTRPARESGDTLPAWLRPTATEPPPAPEPATEDEDSEPTRHIWRVADLVGEVRTHIESAYRDLWVQGEISNLRAAPSGHLYFTLKDGDAQLPAVLFRRQAQALRFCPEDGLEVLLRGKVSVYEQRGQMQLIAEYLEPVGAGSLQIAFEQLKAKLAAEGLFALDRKHPLPAYPHCVGIVTSPTGAVIRDFLSVAGRRHAALDILLYPAAVQGTSAAAEVAAGIAHFNYARTVDVIVIARGGGSLEDLAPFNSELLARAIAASTLPVVSAVGHETDFTIADFVADLRAPTPSAAAELITAAQHKIEDHLEALAARLTRATRLALALSRQHFTRHSIEACHARLRDALGRREQRLDEQRFRFERALSASMRNPSTRVAQLTALLLRHDPTAQLRVMRERLANQDQRLARALAATLAQAAQQHASVLRTLENLSPLAVLNRGYALVRAANGTLITSAAQAAHGDNLHIRLASGSLDATVNTTSQEP